MKTLLKDYSLVLGGGGTRGLAHIGVLKELGKIKTPSKIIGCSMGALVGALYALYKDVNIVHEKIISIIESKKFKNIKIGKTSEVYESFLLMTLLYRRKYLVSHETMRELLKPIISEELTFKDTKISLSLSTFELSTGKSVLISEGNLLDGVIASMAIPGIVQNIEINNNIFVDGGVTGSVPFYALNENENNIIVDVGFIPENKKEFKNALEIYHRSFEWQIYYYEKMYRENHGLKSKYFFIFPKVQNFQLKDFGRYKEIIRKGEEEAFEEINKIKKYLKYSLYEKIKKIVGYSV
jgi:NTE family protein